MKRITINFKSFSLSHKETLTFIYFNRLHNARKSSDENNLTDVFHRHCETSDPVISDISEEERLAALQKIPLPAEVLSLLKKP